MYAQYKRPTMFTPITKYELTQMIRFSELDRPFEDTSDWLHDNLCRLWWFEDTYEMMVDCYDMIPYLNVSDAHKEFALAHFEKYKIMYSS